MNKEPYFIVEDTVVRDGRYGLVIRNGDSDIHVGDWYGCCEVLGLESYGKKLDVLGKGMTGVVFLSGKPPLCVLKTEDQEFITWLKNKRNPTVSQ